MKGRVREKVQTRFKKLGQIIKTKPVLLVLLMNILLAMSGFLKDVLFAHYLGTSRTADSFTFAYFIADTIANNLIATALGVVSVPIFTALVLTRNRRLLKKVTAMLSTNVFMCMAALALILYIAGKLAARSIGGDLLFVQYHLAHHYFTLMLPSFVLFPLALIGSSLLQSQGKYFVPAVGPVLFNSIFIVCVALCILFRVGDDRGGSVLSWSISIGAAVYALYIWKYARTKDSKTDDEMNVDRNEASVYKNSIIAHFFPYVLLLTFTQVLLFVERYLAFRLPEGTVAALNYAYRLAQMPIWVFVSAITTVILPEFSRALSTNTFHLTIKKMKAPLVYAILFSLGISGLLFVLREPVIALLFKRGAFSNHSVHMTAAILAGYSLSIPGTSISLIGIRYYVAKRKLWLPLLLLFVTTALSVIFDVLLTPNWGAAALGYGAAFGSTVNGLLFITAIVLEWKKIAREGVRG